MSILFTSFFWLAVGLSAADWLTTVWEGVRPAAQRIRWLTKPAAMLAIAVWFSLSGGWRGELFWFGAGLVFSLLGDIFLLPRGLFLAGMGAFFTAHLFYIIGFSRSPLQFSWLLLVGLLVLLPIFILFIRVLRASLKKHHQEGMILPVTLYALIICLMVLAAFSTLFRPAWGPLPARLVTVGAALFLVSDGALAVNRFVRTMRWGDPLVMVTYHVAQMFIATGALTAFV